jgi:hypothetical protein
MFPYVDLHVVWQNYPAGVTLPCMCSMVCAVPGHQSMLAGPPFQGVRMTLGTPGEVDRNLTL